ncbi:MAG TPA: serine hydrolase [Pseudorhizobium sp.]|jgi:CubicO group peptidase (beta-lactamase class C family)|nr:serine hydrolase [Pseudorhizobium sp.]
MIATLAASARFRGACAAALALCMAGTTLAAPATPAELPRPELLLRWEGDAQVEGYRNIAKIFPTHAVARGAKTYELPRAKREIAPKYTLEKERGSVAEYMKNNRTAGLIVVKDGKIVLERYGLGQTDKSHWIAFSMAKSVTSTLLGAAIADGKIGSVDEQVVKYIPELRGSAYDGVTIEQVLQMRSGVAWNEDYADPNSDVGRLGAARGSDRGVALVETMATLKRAAEPGSRFNYSTGESNLIGVILKRAIDEPLASYLSRKVWQPFGMESDATWVTDQSGQEFGGCCVNATLRDYARLGLFAMQGGVANGQRVVPEGWFAKATHPATPNAWDGLGYGYQWWLPSAGTFQAIGVFGQSIYIDPARNLIIAESSAWPEAGYQKGYERQYAFRKAVIQATDGSAPR